MNPRVVIDRLDLDLRGIDPDVARRAVYLLGPALQAALADAGMSAGGQAASTARLDAGRIDVRGAHGTHAATTPQTLAAALAGRIAGRLGGGTPKG